MLRKPEGLWNITDSKVRHTVTPSAPETGSAAAKHIHQTENRYRRPTPSQIGGLRLSSAYTTSRATVWPSSSNWTGKVWLWMQPRTLWKPSTSYCRRRCSTIYRTTPE